MKTNFSAISIILLFLFFGTQQTLFSQQFNIKSGLLISSFPEKELPDEEHFYQSEKENIFLSIQAELTLNNYISIVPSLAYKPKGHIEGYFINSELPNNIRGTKYTVSISYLEIPVLAKLYLNNDPTRFFVNAGPYASIALSGNAKTVNDENLLVTDNLSWNSKNGINSFNRHDYGVIFGLGAQFKKMLMGINIGRGLNTISIFDDAELNKVKNKTWMVYIGYFI